MISKDNEVIIGVGSKNPVKIKAVKETIQEVYQHLNFKVNIMVEGYEVDSGVANQPIGLDNIYLGALNRAREVSKINEFSYNVGIEAGIYVLDDYNIDIQFCVIIDKNGWTTVGHGGGFIYPLDVIELVKKGKEIGEIYANISGNENIKNEEGAIGLLSKGLIDRTRFSKQSVLMAMLPRISPNYYV